MRLSITPLLFAGLALLLPFFAMLVTDEVTWSVADFVIFGALVFGAVAAYEVAARTTGNVAYRAAIGVALAAAFLLVWANGAVGLIGSEDNPANLMVGGVLAIGIAGAIVARLRPRGMARALVGGPGLTGPIPPGDVVMSTGFFAALWLLSAWLFRKAARRQMQAGAASAFHRSEK